MGAQNAKIENKKNVHVLHFFSLENCDMLLEQTFVTESYLGERMSCAKIENKKKVYGLEFMKFAELWYDVRNKLRLLNLTGNRG